ncbi:MAG: hypothetical protein WBP45_02350 [Daejeonella sp.]
MTNDVLTAPFFIPGDNITAKFDNINGKLIEGTIQQSDGTTVATWEATKQ